MGLKSIMGIRVFSGFGLLVGSAMSLGGCVSNGSESGTVLGSDVVTQSPASLTDGAVNQAPSSSDSIPAPLPPPPGSPAGPAIGTSCESADVNHLCVALKYVVYENSQGTPVVSSNQVVSNLTAINKIWDQCNIAFQADEFLVQDPRDVGLTFNTANNSELDVIRRTFDNDSTLLLVTTGSWNRNGSLGSTGANAWANMPGNSVMGVILESPVGDYANIIAHELGHYLNLDHVSDASDLMNPIIYSTSTKLTSNQCSIARSTISRYWSKMVR